MPSLINPDSPIPHGQWTRTITFIRQQDTFIEGMILIGAVRAQMMREFIEEKETSS